MEATRETFLRRAFARLHEEQVPYCVSRNAGELYHSLASDVDLVVPSGSMGEAEKVLDIEAELHGYRQIARMEFTNLCLVYWAPGARFVRIDLDGELRWHIFEIADAPVLLEGADQHDGAVLISPRGEWFVLADRLAWAGELPARYRERLARLRAEGNESSHACDPRLVDFLSRGDARGLRVHLVLQTLFSARRAFRALVHFSRDLARLLRRIVSPPGVFLKFNGQPGTMDWSGLFRTMAMAFPESKCIELGASPLPGLKMLFRGGLVITSDKHPWATGICRVFSSRRRRFRVAAPSCAAHDDLVLPSSSDMTATFADALASAILARR